MDVNDKARPRFTTTLRREPVMGEGDGLGQRFRAKREAQVNADTYKLVTDLRPSNTNLALTGVGLAFPRPILCTYKGVRTGHVVNHEVHV